MSIAKRDVIDPQNFSQLVNQCTKTHFIIFPNVYDNTSASSSRHIKIAP